MGRRKGIKEEEVVPQVLVSPDEPPAIYMDKMDMMTLQLREAQVGQLREQTEKYKLRETLLLLEQRAALGSLRSQIRDLEKQLQLFVDDYNAVRAGIEKKLGVNLSEYGVGDDGKLMKAPN